MYLLNRLPLPINQSAFFLFPRQSFKTPREHNIFAAEVIKYGLHFQHLIEVEKLEQDYSGAKHAKRSPLCMETYKYFFNSYRRPGAKNDYQISKKLCDGDQCVVVIHRKQ
ncbi:choline O-acetyltransferase-like, partial [Tropilaelaps mercedesae]